MPAPVSVPALALNGVFASYDTWMTDTDVDADIEPPLELDGPWQVCVVVTVIVGVFMAYIFFSDFISLCLNGVYDMWNVGTVSRIVVQFCLVISLMIRKVISGNCT